MYADYLLPGILVQSVAFRSSQTAAVLTGRTLADLVRNTAILALMLVVGSLVGFSFQNGVLNAALAIVLILAFGYSLSWVFAAVAFVAKGAEAAQSAGFVAIFPLVFASSVFVPVDTMPDWLQGFATYNPVSVTADAARSWSIGGPAASAARQSIAWSVGVTLVRGRSLCRATTGSEFTVGRPASVVADELGTERRPRTPACHGS